MAVNYMSSVPKLVGRENYAEWCFAMENFFVLEGFSDCLFGKQTDTVMVAKAKAKLILTLDPSIYVHIRDKNTCKEVWDTLKNMYEDNGFTRKIALLRTLISLRLENCSSMEAYVTQIIETSRKLGRTGFHISEEWIGSLLLAGLPECFSPMIMALEHSGIAISSDQIKTKLLDMEVDGDVHSTAANAFASRTHFRKNPKGGSTSSGQIVNTENGRPNRNKVVCYKCKQPGHFKNKCPNSYQKRDSPKENKSNAFSAVFLTNGFNDDDWYVDSAATNHVTSRKDWLLNVEQADIDKITVANNEHISVDCVGQANITTIVNNQKFDIVVNDVLYVPKLSTNLLSVSQLTKRGNRVVFTDQGCQIYNRNGTLISTADLVNNMYKLNLNKPKSSFLATAVSGDIWHRRFGHINYKDLSLMQDAVNGMDIKGKLNNRQPCDVCCEGKQCRLPFKNVGTRATQVLETVHADLCGPMEVSSLGGSKYYFLLEDDFSRMTFTYFLKHKNEALKYFKVFKTLVENQTNNKIKALRTDNGGEFCSSLFEKFLSEHGIIHQKTNPYTPQKNGMSERMNRTLVEKARCLLFDAGLKEHFWAEAVNTAVYLRNRSIVTGLKKTPYEIWTKKKPSISNIRIFGSEVMMLIPAEKRKKFDKKSYIGRFL